MHNIAHSSKSRLQMGITKRLKANKSEAEIASFIEFYTLSKDILTNMYVSERLSTVKIAKKYCVSTSNVSNRLLEFNIPIRSISEAQRGNKLSEEHKEKIRQKHIGLKTSEETKEKHRQYNKEHPPTQEQREKMEAPNRKLFVPKDVLNDLYCVQQYSSREIAAFYNVSCGAVSALMKKYGVVGREMDEVWEIPRFQEKLQKALSIFPNKLETSVIDTLNKYFPNEWKYTGDFSLFVGGKNPDFVNIAGKPLLIDIFGDYWHRGENPQDRIDFFKQYGYDTLVFWEKEIKTNISDVINKITNFMQ